MPRLNTSEAVRKRIERLLGQLLAYANGNLTEYDYLRDKVRVRWVDEYSIAPKLIVKTELRFLVELVFERQSNPLKETIKQDLRVLKAFLEILEDNRTKTQGSANWHFTLRLWHHSIERNLNEFNREWQRRKSLRSKSFSSEESQSAADHTSVASSSKLRVNRSSQPFFSQSESTSALDAEIGSKLFKPASEPSLLLASRNPTRKRTPPFHNLPACDHTAFIGRQEQIDRLLNLLCFDSPVARISVEGIGGVGKTSLVLEVAHRCLQFRQNGHQCGSGLPSFDAIIFISAKPQHFTTRGIVPRFTQARTLRQIFRAIARTLDYSPHLSNTVDNQLEIILSGNLGTQLERIQASLARQTTLLIADNLETIEEQQEVFSFLYDLPSTVKAIVTSREHAQMDAASIRLAPLPQTEGLHFIQHQAQVKEISLSSEHEQSLYQGTGGIPAAMVYAMGQLANGYQFQDALPRLTLAAGDFCRFYFEGSIKPLRSQPAHHVLMALAMFPKPALREAIAQVACPETNVIDDFARLHQLSLVTLQDGRYTMLPLTREYALAELNAHPTFGETARERWVNWYLNFLTHHGEQEWREWPKYDLLDREWGNIQAVIEWCIDQGRYNDFSQLWQYVKGYTHLCGYWNERLGWINWWVQEAKQRSNIATVAQALLDKAWTLILMGQSDQLVEAETVFRQIQQLQAKANPQFQLELAIEQAILFIHQKNLKTARQWLETAKDVLEQIQLDEPKRLRQVVRLHYYEAEVYFRMGDYNCAKNLYRNAVEKARIVQWQQVEVYALNWLADIALEQENLHEASRLLMQSLPIAEKNQDKRSIAFHKRSQAHLAKLKGDRLEFQRCFAEARACFEELAMTAEVERMQRWMET